LIEIKVKRLSSCEVDSMLVELEWKAANFPIKADYI